MDYQQIIDNLTTDRVKSILDKLDIPYSDKGNCLIMPTYCHNHKTEEASHKLYYYKNNKLFVCYTECGNMSIFKFLHNYYESQGIEYDWYNDIYRVIVGETNPEGFVTPKYHSLKETYGVKSKNLTLAAYNEGALGCFIKHYTPEWLSDHITPTTMDKFNILYSISQNKIIIPHRDTGGRLVGIRGRALNQDEIDQYGKYAPIWLEGKCYSHPLSMNLYGLYENKSNIQQSHTCYLFESEKSVLQCESFSFPNCAVAVCGSQFNKFQLNLLLKTCMPSNIVICFDREEKPGETKYFDKLYQICQKYKNYANFSFIYDRQGITKLKDSPSDNGESIFKQLISKKVVIK